MSLPASFENASDYFEEALIFFNDFKNLYNFPNTNVLLEGVLQNMHINNIQNIDVFDDTFNIEVLVENNEFIDELLHRSKRLKVECEPFSEFSHCPSLSVPISEKKKHELIYLSEEVKRCCAASKCDLVVDFGSGLGYLDQYIFETTAQKVLGVESNKQYYVGAKKRQNKYYESSLNHVKYVKHTVTATSGIALGNIILEKFPSYGNFCIIGLHACADLTVDALNLFFEMPNAKSLILMPCCYHKMKIKQDTGVSQFVNFPLSAALRGTFEKYKSSDFMRVPFLRLACQPSVTKENLKSITFNLISRAVLQVYCEKNNCKLERKRQKASKSKFNGDFHLYLKNVTSSGYSLKCKNSVCNVKLQENIATGKNKCTCNIQFDVKDITDIWQHYSDSVMFKLAAIFILIQRHLQPIFENFILFDRLLYMKEMGSKNCLIKKVVNEKISPRCYALIAYK